MTKRSLASLCLKLMAVYIIVSFMHSLPQSLTLIYSAFETPNTLLSIAMVASALIGIVFWVGLGLFFIRFADAIAQILVPKNEDADVITISNGDSLYKVFFVCLGMLLTVQVLPVVTQVICYWHMADKYGLMSTDDYFNTQLLPDIIWFTVQIGLGVFLMIRPDTVLSWVNKFQPHENSLDDNCDDHSNNLPEEE